MSFKTWPEYRKLQDSVFHMVMLKKCSESLLWGRCKSTAPVSENADVLRLPVKASSSLIFGKRAHVRRSAHPLSFSQEFTLSLVNHVAGVRPLRMPSRRYAFSARSTGASPCILSTNPVYSVVVVLRPSRHLPLDARLIGCF